MNPPLKAHFFAIIIPDGAGGPPSLVESETLEGLSGETYKQLMAHKAGWCYLFTGNRMLLSTPRQVFLLQTPEGKQIEVTEPVTMTYEANGRFSTLKSATDKV